MTSQSFALADISEADLLGYTFFLPSVDLTCTGRSFNLDVRRQMLLLYKILTNSAWKPVGKFSGWTLMLETEYAS